MRERVGKDLWEEYDNLKVGDTFPIKLQSVNMKPYSKKEAVAKAYAKEGHLTMIVKVKVPQKHIIADLENIIPFVKDIDQDILDDSNYKYFKKDKEVIVSEPIQNAEIIMKTGKLSR